MWLVWFVGGRFLASENMPGFWKISVEIFLGEMGVDGLPQGLKPLFVLSERDSQG